MKRWLVVMGLSLAACGSDDSGGGRQFKDTAGRTCTVSGDDVSCSGQGKVCEAPSMSTFVVMGLQESPMQMCPGCKDADGSTSYDTDACTQIICESSNDCGFPAATCNAGKCWCAPGQC
jgi:hypothetical protein